jgi:hypothetical protein
MIVEKQMECRLAGETELLGRKPAPAPLLSITKSHMARLRFETEPPRWEAGDYPPANGRCPHTRLDAGGQTRRPGFASDQHVEFVVDKAEMGQVFSEYFGFPYQSFHQLQFMP